MTDLIENPPSPEVGMVEQDLRGASPWLLLRYVPRDLKPAASGALEAAWRRVQWHPDMPSWAHEREWTDDWGDGEYLRDFFTTLLQAAPSTPPQVEREGSRDDLEALDLDAPEKVARRMCRRNWTDNDSQAFDDTFTPPAVLRLIATNREMDGEIYALRCAITGGEDAPGYVMSLPLQRVLDVATENHAAHGDDIDRAMQNEARAEAAEASNRELKAELERYRAPGGWRNLMAADARRVLGDPFVGVTGAAISNTLSKSEGSRDE